MPTSLIVVDDFFRPRDAQALRETALGMTYPEQEGAFPGRNSRERLDIDGLLEAASRLTGERLKPISPLQSHGKFRISLAGEQGRGGIHIDQRAYWSGILYLSRAEDCVGGTEFYRHLKTGTDRAPFNEEEARAMGFSSIEEMHRQIVEKDGIDQTRWELTMRVPMRFNRLVLLRPWLWHTAGAPFGDNAENGRLVYLMFFDAA